jgi:hypothetical protein
MTTPLRRRRLFVVFSIVWLACVVARAAQPKESANDSADPTREITSVKLSQSGADVVIDVEAAKDWNFDTLLLFVRTDHAGDRGYEPTGRTGTKFDVVVQGSVVNEFAGKDARDWSWKPVGDAKTKNDGRTYHVEIPAALLRAKQIQLGAWAMSGDWVNVQDIAPDEGYYSLDVKQFGATAGASTNPAAAADQKLAAPRANRDRPPRERFRDAKSYYCYYGPDKLSELSQYDIGILHVPAMKPENVATLNKLGVVTVGYISVGEDETLRDGDGQGPGGKASWYFDKDRDNQPDKNGVWGSYFANAGDPKWRADRVAEARRLVDEYGFDGFFLDTIEVPDLYPDSRPGMIQLVQELRQAFPDKVIVANRAFNLLKEPAVSSNIDGIMFESFSTSYDFDSKQYIKFQPQDLDATRRTIERDVMPAIKQHGIRVLALDYCKPDQTDWIQFDFDRAVTFGFLPAVAPISLNEVYDTRGIVGKPDAKYLTRLATPQTLSVKLDAARNGFPAGTIVRPDSCYLGYTAAAVVDGIQDRSKLHWTKAAWASEEDPATPHGLAFILGQRVSGGGKLRVTFAFDNKQWFPSRKFAVEVQDRADGPWQLIYRADDNRNHTVDLPLPAKPIAAIRITQDANGASESRPALMWVQQVELVK